MEISFRRPEEQAMPLNESMVFDLFVDLSLPVCKH